MALHEQLAEVFYRWGAQIKAKLLSLGSTESDAEDIVQEAILRALVHIDGIQPSRMRAWLFRVAINEFYSLTRRRSRESPAALLPSPEAASNQVEEEAIRMEEIGRLRLALSKLAPRERQLLTMKYARGMTCKQIGSATKTKPSSAKVALYRARKILLRLYGETGGRCK